MPNTGRPYHKNDNRFVEQKNSSIVRAYLGYGRLDTVQQVKAMNSFYEKLWLYYNCFQPVLRLKDKEVVSLKDGTCRVRHRYGGASTPLDRLCATGVLSEEKKEALMRLRQGVNPRQLRKEIRELADAILRMPGAERVSKAQDVYLTLHHPPARGSVPLVTLSFDRTDHLR